MHRNRDGMCDIFAVINNKCKNKTSSPRFWHNYLAQNAFGTVNKLTSESNLLPPVIMMAFLDAQGVFCFLRSRAFCTLLPIQATTTTKPLRSLDRSSERKKKSGPRAPVSFSSSATCKTSALRVVILLFSSSTPLIVRKGSRIISVRDSRRARLPAKSGPLIGRSRVARPAIIVLWPAADECRPAGLLLFCFLLCSVMCVRLLGCDPRFLTCTLRLCTGRLWCCSGKTVEF